MLQEYLYNLNTVNEVLEQYIEELKKEDKHMHANALMAYKSMIQDRSFVQDARDLFNQIYNLIDSKHPNLQFSIAGRCKSIISTERKILRYLELDEKVEQIHDFFAFRIIIFGNESLCLEEHCYKIMHEIIEYAIKGGYTPCSKLPLIDSLKKPQNDFNFNYSHFVKDYIKYPKKNGYQSLHLVLRDQKGRYFEIQVRTFQMHIHAETSNSANHAYYKKAKYKKFPLLLDRDKISVYGYFYNKDDNGFEHLIDYAGIEQPVMVFQRQKVTF